MKEKLLEIIEECCKWGINVHLKYKPSGICYEIEGFSKSGVATLSAEEERIVCETRYNQVNSISSFTDLSEVAFWWYENYKNRSPFNDPDEKWLRVWLQEGRLTARTITTYE